MNKYNRKFIGLCSLFVLLSFFFSQTLAENSRKYDRLKDDVKGNVQLVFDNESEGEKTQEVEEVKEEKKPSFFEKLFGSRKSNEKDDVKEESSEDVAENKEEKTDEPESKTSPAEETTEEAITESKEKKPSFFSRLFGSRKSNEKDDVKEESSEDVAKNKEEKTDEPESTPEPTEEIVEAKKGESASEEKAEETVAEEKAEKKPSFFNRLFGSRKSNEKDDMKEESSEVIAENKEEKTEEPESSEETTENKAALSETQKTPSIFPTWLKRTLGIKNRSSSSEKVETETVDVSKDDEASETPIIAEVEEKEEEPKKKTSLFSGLKSLFKKSKEAQDADDNVATSGNVAASEEVTASGNIMTESEEEPALASTNSKNRKFKNPFRNFWKKSPKTTSDGKAIVDAPSPFHNPEEIQSPQYKEGEPQDDALGVIGDVKGDQVGPFSRPGKYDLSGTNTGLLLPINNKDELNTKEDIVSVIMKQPALMSVDSFSSLSINKVVTINEVILNRGRFRLKTLDEAGLWTIRGRDTLLSVASNTDVIFDMTGTLITKVFVLEGKAHCLPKVGERPVELDGGQMMHLGLTENKSMDISEEQTNFFKNRFTLSSEEDLTKKLKAAGAFSTRQDKNWPMESKVYSGILCTNCSYAFDAREDYYDVCPVCHASLIEVPEASDDAVSEDENVIQPKKSKKNYKWSKWFFGIKPKKSTK